MATSDFFSPDYSSAREAFLAAARGAGAGSPAISCPITAARPASRLPWMRRPWAQQSPSRCCC
jgi:hypothetical protein